MKIIGDSPEEYLFHAPANKRQALTHLRHEIVLNIPKGFEEQMSYGMIGYVVPHSTYPSGYHCNTDLPLPFINIAAQKNFIAIYHMGIYASPELMVWFKEEWKKRNLGKLDMGKSCIRFKKPEQIPFDLIGELVRKMSVNEWIQIYESSVKR
jgi:uncharacterized protein YdhG (YjbR/CyaY superfamily)